MNLDTFRFGKMEMSSGLWLNQNLDRVPLWVVGQNRDHPDSVLSKSRGVGSGHCVVHEGRTRSVMTVRSQSPTHDVSSQASQDPARSLDEAPACEGSLVCE